MKLKLIGAYLPSLDRGSLLAAAQNEAARFRQVNLDLISQGVSTATINDVDERTPEYAEEIARGLESAALFEAAVVGNSEEFDGRCFYCPENDGYGWSPTFLTEDGSRLLTDDPEETTYESNFRVLFFINDWGDDFTLEGPHGPLKIPVFKRVPERVWKLAAYETLD